MQAPLGILFTALAMLLPAQPTRATDPPLAIDAVTVIDVARPAQSGVRTVLVTAGRIAALGDPGTLAIPPDAVRVDGRGKFLAPGLVDLHVHLFNNASRRPPNDWAFGLFVANGVTGVREMHTLPGQLAQVARWRDAVERGELIAPRVLAAGVAVGGVTAGAARREVSDAAAAGAGFIKVFSEVPPAQWRVILDAARENRIAVDGHVPAAVALRDAARAGQRTAEHLMQAYEACSSIEARVLGARAALDGDAAVALRDRQEQEVLEHFDRAACARTARSVAAAHQVQVPTLVLSRFESARDPGFAGDPRWPSLRADEQARWNNILVGETAADHALAKLRWDVSCRIVRAFHGSGVRILAGTDAPMPLVYPGYSLHDELEALVACGLGNAEALRAATLGAAQLLGLEDDAGTIAVGKRADLMLVAADPRADIRNLRRIDAVVLAGRLLRRDDLAKLAPGP